MFDDSRKFDLLVDNLDTILCQLGLCNECQTYPCNYNKKDTKIVTKESKPVQIYFRSPSGNDVTKLDPNVVAEYNKILPVDVATCDSWDELDTLLSQKPNQLSIHANVFALTDISYISETLKMLQRKLKILRLEIPIAIVVERTTPRNIVEKAKEAGIQGLVPYHGDWDNEDIMQGLNALTNRIIHWPEHIINQLPISKPIHVLFRTDWEEQYTSNIVNTVSETLNLTIICCTEWNKLGDILKENPSQIAVHVGMLGLDSVTVHEFISMLETLVKLSANKPVPVAIIIDNTTPLSIVRELQKTNVLGIIPSAPSFGVAESMKGVEALTNRIPYYPKHILEQLPGAVKKTVTKNSITLTDRQMQVVNLITERGLTNKKIAKALNITESTVKIHVSAILKAYGVRTRTQLVVMSQK